MQNSHSLSKKLFMYSFKFNFIYLPCVLGEDFNYFSISYICRLKIQQDQADTTDSHWKKKYYDVDKQCRNLKEDFDVLVARNKNGR